MKFKTLLNCGLSVILYTLAIHSFGLLIFVALTPALVVLVKLKRARDLAIISATTGAIAAFFVQHTLWIVSLPGTAFLSIYQGFIWIPMVFAVRFSKDRLNIPISISWPFVWCGGEVLRSLGPLGTIFGTLAVPQTTAIWMLQIVDLGGATIAAFPLAALQGWFADMILTRNQQKKPFILFPLKALPYQTRTGTIFVVLVWISVGFYGNFRLKKIEQGMKSGPEIGVVATDILTMPSGESSYDKTLLLEKLQDMSEELVRKSPEVELILWPEGMLGNLIPNRLFLESEYEPRMAAVIAKKTGQSINVPSLSYQWDAMIKSASEKEQQFQSWVKKTGVPILTGMDTWITTQSEHTEPFLLQNSAVLFSPDTGQTKQAQAKMRLYPLGEYFPFKDSIMEPLMQFFLGKPRANYTAGSKRFRYSIGPAGPNYAVALCSELKFDHLRGIEPNAVSNKPYEILVNIANEGLFQRNGMPEIFAFCATLRAIENRVTVIRSSNSGISGFWSPTGKRYGIVKNANGQIQTKKGAAEIEAILKVIEFRKQHANNIQINPSIQAELSTLINNVEQIRSNAAVEGYSSRPTYWLPEKTIFNKHGAKIKLTLISILFLLNITEALISLGRHKKRAPALI